MANITETVPFNFNELYTELQTKFADKGYDIEEGSNTSQLITAMAYLTSMLNVNTAVNINETILPLATKRDNALQDARALGYEVAHKQSYKYRLTIMLDQGDHTIPKYTEFTADGKSYYYMGKQLEFTGVPVEGKEISIDVKEGTLYKFIDNPEILNITTSTILDSNGNTIAQYYVDIPFADVEEDGIEVFLTYYDELGNLYNKEQWYQEKQFALDKDTNLTGKFVRIDNIQYKTPRIYFKYGGIGTGVRIGTIVDINVLTTNGIDGGISDISDPTIMSTTIENIEITAIEIILEGTNEESLASIQENAPRFWNSANRAVTKSDYVAICDRHSAVKTSQIWGGDDEFPKCPGHIWFSFLPSTYTRAYDIDTFSTDYQLQLPEDTTNWFVENEEIRSTQYSEDGILYNPGVWDVLDNYKIPTLEFHNRHPVYLDFQYDLEILKYNIKTSKADIHQEVFDVIDNYFTGIKEAKATESFNIEYFHSSLMKRIDTDLSDISGFNNALTTKLMICDKNISTENTEQAYKDLFLQFAIPFEDYFTTSGELITSVLPSIDTENFIEETGMNIYTDWSNITGNVSTDQIIIAPIRAHLVVDENVTENISAYNIAIPGSGQYIPQTTIVAPDDAAATVLTYNLTTISVDGNIKDYGVHYTIDQGVITFMQAINAGSIIRIENNNIVGHYNLFNNYKKYITIQFYINAIGYGGTGTTIRDLYAGPKSYLTTDDGFYDFTINSYYLTTEGFAIFNETTADSVTGSSIKKVPVEAYYTLSTLTRDLFDTIRYMNLNYHSPNFKLMKNIIPRLRSVTFA